MNLGAAVWDASHPAFTVVGAGIVTPMILGMSDTRRPELRNQSGLRNFLRVGGIAAVVVGVVLIALALHDMFDASSHFDSGPGRVWLMFIGIPLLGVGSTMLKAGFLGTATTYAAGEVTPTVKSTLDYLGAGPAATCRSCGETVGANARFCDRCGAAVGRVCSSCHAENDADASFCGACGESLRPN